jgi:hypothetical protein
MSPTAYIAHQIPGRVRLKIPAKRGDARYFESIASLFTDCREVHYSETNPTTGSILILHEGDLMPLIQRAEQQSLFQIACQPSATIPLKARTTDSFKQTDSSLKNLTNGGLDLATVLFLGLIALAIYQALEGNVLAPASTLLWYAFATLSFAPTL